MPFSGLSAALAERERAHLLRRRRVVESACGPVVRVDGKHLLTFCSNDYLGLANHPDVVAAFTNAAREYGVGSGASHLVSGHHRSHQALEEEFAAFLNRPRAVLFSSGYMANLGVISALLGRDDLLIEDKLNHASLLDAGQLSGARMQRFVHGDMASLAQRLAGAGVASRTLVAVDGVFSMDGDLAPLPDMVQQTKASNAWLMVDDAHGVGVLGRHGGGVCEQFGLSTDDVPVLMCTLGKALGTAGAVVSGSDTLIDTLLQFARTYIYTTALPPALAEATRASLRIVQAEPERRAHLHRLIAQFRTGAAQLGLNVMPSDTAIQPLRVGDSDAALRISEQLEARGILITPIRPPTVPAGSARLRITLSAVHSAAQVDQLLQALAEVMPS
ncbi:MAG TPA: 8-amino-7-oxononanoate synthase [Pseudomonadales bacterium]